MTKKFKPSLQKTSRPAWRPWVSVFMNTHFTCQHLYMNLRCQWNDMLVKLDVHLKYSKKIQHSKMHFYALLDPPVREMPGKKTGSLTLTVSMVWSVHKFKLFSTHTAGWKLGSKQSHSRKSQPGPFSWGWDVMSLILPVINSSELPGRTFVPMLGHYAQS